MNFKDYFFPEYTLWEIIDVFEDANSRYCLSVRANKKTGLREFKTTTILDRSFTAKVNNLTKEHINALTLII